LGTLPGVGEAMIEYVPGESNSGLFGGNSNWRGPIWLPTNYTLVQALEKFHRFLGDNFTVAVPSLGNRELNLKEIATLIAERLVDIYRRDANGQMPAFPADSPFQHDPHWRDLLQFYEYFHGDTGQGLGRRASDRLDRPAGESGDAPLPAKTSRPIGASRWRPKPTPSPCGEGSRGEGRLCRPPAAYRRGGLSAVEGLNHADRNRRRRPSSPGQSHRGLPQSRRTMRCASPSVTLYPSWMLAIRLWLAQGCGCPVSGLDRAPCFGRRESWLRPPRSGSRAKRTRRAGSKLERT
jgi:hypothetical protein